MCCVDRPALQHLFFTFFVQTVPMVKSITADVQRNNAERELFAARRALSHLVEMFDNGRWRSYYKTEQAFAEAVRERRMAVDRWTDVVSKVSAESATAR